MSVQWAVSNAISTSIEFGNPYTRCSYYCTPLHGEQIVEVQICYGELEGPDDVQINVRGVLAGAVGIDPVLVASRALAAMYALQSDNPDDLLLDVVQENLPIQFEV